MKTCWVKCECQIVKLHSHIRGLLKVALRLVSATRKWISELNSVVTFIVEDNFVSSLNGISTIYGSLLKMLETEMGR